MKIAHITDALPESHKKWGGAEQVTIKTIEALEKAGVQNIILCRKPEQWKMPYDFLAVGSLEESTGWRISSAIRSILPFDFKAYADIKKYLKEIQPDAVHIHNVSEISLAAILAAKKLGIKTVLAVYDYWYFCPKRILVKVGGEICHNFHGAQCRGCYGPKRMPRTENLFLPLRRKIFDYFLKKVDKFLVLSEASADLLNLYGISRDRLVVIPAPIEPVFNSSVVVTKNILFAAWLSPHKGLHIIIDAMPTILKEIPGARLVVSANGGDAEYRQKINNMLKLSGIENQIRIFDKSTAQLKDLIKDAAVIVIPEQWENMSPVLMFECALAGVPMVLSRIGGIPEFIGDERFLATYNNSEEWAQKILWILKNQGEAEKLMSQIIKPKIIKSVNIGDNIKKLISVYQNG